MNFSEYFLYDPDSGLLIARFTRGPLKKGSIAGSIGKNGYLRVGVEYKDYYVHRIAWEIYHGEPAPEQIDHINCIKTDNRIGNLRLANNSHNSMNRHLQSNNTSGFKGVSLHKLSGLWFAYANRNGKRFSGGYHKTPEEAALAAEELRDKLHINFSRHQ